MEVFWEFLLDLSIQEKIVKQMGVKIIKTEAKVLRKVVKILLI